MEKFKRIIDQAADAIVKWVKDINLSSEIKMRDAVNAFMKESGADNGLNHEAIIDRRRICAYQLLRDCITPLSKEELRFAKRKLMHIVEDDAHQSAS